MNCCSSFGGGGGIFDAIRSFFSGLFGGGGSHLSASQQAAQTHGINLSKSLPHYAGGSFQADAVNTFSVYQDVGASYGIDPNDVRLGVTPLAADPSVENEIDGATVTASRAGPGDFNFAAIGRTPAFTAIGLPMKIAAGGVLGAPLLAVGVGILPFAAEGVEGVPGDSALVCRGGTCTAARFANGSGVSIDSAGNLQGVSVNSANGALVEDLTVGIPNGQVGVTTVGDIRAAGGDVIPSPTAGNPFHCTLCGISPSQAEDLFTPTIPNPSR